MTRLLGFAILLAACSDSGPNANPQPDAGRPPDAASSVDAAPPTHCGNGVCEVGETISTCPQDCAAATCTPSDPNSCTGETVCIGTTCENAFGRFYKIKVISAVFTETNASGGTWDPLGGLPDPKVNLDINGTTFSSPVISDTLSPVWNYLSPAVLIPGGSDFKINVVDSDIAGDDAAWGCENNPLGADLIRAGAVCGGTGALSAAHVNFAFVPQ
jgi:hypothetical protein